MQHSERRAKVSFIIPHKDRLDMLQDTLLSISRQEYPLDNIEVIIASQNSTIKDDIFPPGLCCTPLYFPDSQSISELRNKGYQHSKGEYIAFIDADVYLSSNWVTTMLDTINADSGRVLVSAMQVSSSEPTVLEVIRVALSNAQVDCDVTFLPGRNLFLTREIFEKSGGFPEHLMTCEDYFFTQSVSELGKLYYSSKANYVHIGEDKLLRDMFKKEIWRGQSNLTSLKGRSVPLSELPSLIVPVWILILSLTMIALSIAGRIDLALIDSLFVLAPFIAYSMRLYLVSKKSVPFFGAFRFYSVYFPARIIGSLYGMFAPIRI